MRFGAVSLPEAEGAILAHTHRLPGRVLRKGARLDAAALAALADAGRREIVVARPDADDVSEDAGAARLAESLLGEGIGRTAATTGRVNLVAAQAGLLAVSREGIDALNAVDEGLTVATLADLTVVEPGDMLATVKVIPFAVRAAALDDAVRRAGDAAAAGRPALRLHRFRAIRVGLVVSELPGLKPGVIEATIRATAARVSALTGALLPPLRCAHETSALAACLARLLADGAELLLIAGASAVVDRADVAPAGIVALGGEILHFGMPVDPGNLICLGRIGQVPALVLPGCARSLRPNGIDLVLCRLFAGLTVTGDVVAGLGVGGLIKESDRPERRGQAGQPRPVGGQVAGLVLAAGQSRRMGRNKLLIMDAAGRAMVARTVDAVLASGVRPVHVVLGHQAASVRAALAGRPVRFVEAADHAQGLSASLRAGLASLPEASAGVLVCLGDMPLVGAAVIERVLAAHDPDEGRTIVVPTAGGVRGNPVLWDRRHIPQLLSLAGDQGARRLFAEHEDELVEIETGDQAVLQDFDTPESLAGLADLAGPAR